MKFGEILNESMYSIVSDLTKRASQELFDYDYVYRTRGGMSMFTRMDGMKYRDPNIIFFGNDDAIETLKDYKSGDHKYASKESKDKWHPIWTKMAKTDAYTGIQQFWDWLQQQSGVKKANFRVSGEFGSSKHRDVLVYGKYIFINDGTEVQYGTKSLLRNSPIWRVEKIGEGIVGSAIKDAGRVMTGRVAEIDRVRKLTMLSFKDILRYATLLEEEAIDPVEAGNKIRELALDGIRAVHVKKK